MSRNNRDQGYGGGGSGNVSRKVKQGPVEVDFEDSALVVHYEMETVSCFACISSLIKNVHQLGFHRLNWMIGVQ